MNVKMKYSDLSLLVSSCDEYVGLLNPFFDLFCHYFPSFDGHIFTTASNFVHHNGLNIKCLDRQYKNLSFSSRLLLILASIQTEFVLFLLDDFLLYDYVDEAFFDNAFETIRNDKNVVSVVLHDTCNQKCFCDERYNEYFGVKRKRSPYKCTTQASIWRKDFLIRALRKGESAWDFELIGSYRLFHSNKLVLYRNDMFGDSFPYPRGGVVWGGKINMKYQKYYSIDFTTIKLLGVKKKKEKNIGLKIIHHCLSFFYPPLSLLFRGVHRFGGNSIPKYIWSLNSVDEAK